MNKPLAGKTAIVTGASRGIGRAVAERLGKEGASIIVNYNSNQQKAQEVVEAILANGGRAASVKGDMSIADDIHRLYETAEQHFGPIDIVVSVAAMSIFRPLSDVSREEFDKIFSLNTKGVFLVLQEAAKRVRDGGRIVQFSTGGTRMPMAGGGVYAASKAAGEQFALSLAKELGARKVTVNVISPGVTNTDGLTIPKPALDQLVGQTPLGRLGEPADIADAVAFLVSENARWITGQNLQVNGGIL